MTESEQLRSQLKELQMKMTDAALCLTSVSMRLQSRELISQEDYPKAVNVLNELSAVQSAFTAELQKYSLGVENPRTIDDSVQCIKRIEEIFSKKDSFEVLRRLKLIRTKNTDDSSLSNLKAAAEEVCAKDITAEQLRQEMKPYADFVEAVSSDQIRTEMSRSLYEKGQLSANLLFELLAGYFYAATESETTTTPESEATSEVMEVPAIVQDTIPEATAVPSVCSVTAGEEFMDSIAQDEKPVETQSMTYTVSEEAPVQDLSGIALEESRIKPVALTDEDNANAEELKAAGFSCGVIDDFRYEVLHGDEEPPKNIKQVKKDLERYNSGNLRTLTVMACRFAISPSMLSKIGSGIDYTLNLNSLFDSGYLGKLIPEGREAIYYFTEKARICFTNIGLFKKNVTSCLHNIGKNAFDRDEFDECPCGTNNAAALVGVSACLDIIDSCFPAKPYSLSDGRSRLGMVVERRSYTRLATDVRNYLVVSCVPASDKIPVHLAYNLRQVYLNRKCEGIFIACMGVQNCVILSNFIRKHFGEYIDGGIYLYDISSGVLYRDSDPETAIDLQTVSSELKGITAATEQAEPQSVGEDTKSVDTQPVSEPLQNLINPAKDEKTPMEAIETKSAEPCPKTPEVPVDETFSENETSDEFVQNETLASPQEILDTVRSMIISGKSYCASAYLIALKQNPYASQIYTELAYAVNDPAYECRYSSTDVMNAFSNFDSESVFSQRLYLSAALRMLFYNYSRTDYSYKQLVDMVKHTADGICPEIGSTIYELSKFRRENGTGIDLYADYRLKNVLKIKEMLDKTIRRARDLYTSHVKNPITETINHARFLDTKKMIYQQKNDLVVFLKCVADDSSDMIPMAVEFLNKNGFVENDAEITPANIQLSAIGRYIDEFWYKAADSQRQKHKSADLVSSARNNLIHGVHEVLDVICEWVHLTDSLGNTAHIEIFNKEKHKLTVLISQALEKCRAAFENEREAGLCCVCDTLYELKCRMDSSYQEYRHNYYYSDMLKYGKIMLNEQFLPDIQAYRTAVKGFSPVQRIIEQAALPDRSIQERIDEIFNMTEGSVTRNLGDDYGCARRIKEYLEETSDGFVWDETKDIDQNSKEARLQLEGCRKQFVESLELAQSYGKISPEHKERMHHLEGYEYATAIRTENFGFYNRFVATCGNTIGEEAHVQEEKLRKSLSCIDTSGMDDDTKAKANEMIKQAEYLLTIQNYTVVEDIINRINRDDITDFQLGNGSRDTFTYFLESFNDNYTAVGNSGIALKPIYNSPSNKEQRAANSLIENFPRSGGKMNEQKMMNLLTALGFKCYTVNEVASTLIAKTRCFDITVQKPHSNTKQNYTHPIAPFGSLAVNDGFRTVCMFGRFTADDLIKHFNELGDTKNCIIFLDFALTQQERRTLARKAKQEQFAKVFIVVDRVAIQFLAKNYSESSINSRLMEITMPFSSYQPYVPNSSTPLPLEMFMGRKKQLSSIKSSNGCNIVCGGRQLGKSALLQMAKSEIDRNENGDRAICISILNKNYQRAALVVSRELINEGILAESCETDNWEELCAAIIKRLKSTEDRIPYLLILMDEADDFIDSCKEIEYAPIAELEKIQQIGTGRFKFVVAGLHNLVKLEKEVAECDNSVLARLNTLIVEPFNTLEARELLEVPLHYLGIRFPEDRAYLISNILASTNYFPGLIHTYCEKLIEAMQKSDYAGYNSQSDPPYNISEAHIKKVLADSEFNEQIRQKLMITLKLGSDNLYYIIAILMAYCHKETLSADGFSAKEIYDTGCYWGIKRISNLTEEKVTALMEELCKLNVLTHNHTTEKYFFARFNFIQLLGKPDDIDNEILKYAEEEQYV